MADNKVYVPGVGYTTQDPSKVSKSISYIPWGTGTPKKSTGKTGLTPNPLSNLLDQYSGGVTVAPMSQMPGTTPDPSVVGTFDMGGTGDIFNNPYMWIGDNALYAGKWYSPGEINTQLDAAGFGEATGGGGGGWYGGGGGGGGGTVSPDVTWSEGYSLDGAPEWWRGMLPSTFDANTEYMTLYNAMIPFLSPEDQMNVGRYLYGLVPTKTREPWGTYNPEMMGSANPPVKITTDITEQFTSSERAQNALQALSSLMEASGRTEEKMGPGYQFLRNLLATMGDYGGGAPGSNERQTRAQYQQLQGAVDPLLSQAGGADLSAFKSLASQLTNPFFSAGSVVPISKNAGGQYVFGRPNPEFYA